MDLATIQVNTTCGSLLRELQHIWDEVGEGDCERDKMLVQLEQECLEVYRRKVDQASHAKARLHQAIADAEAEMASLMSLLGDRTLATKGEKGGSNLKEQLAAIQPVMEELRSKKAERMEQFLAVKGKIQKLLVEISGSLPEPEGDGAVFATHGDEQDLTAARLQEYLSDLQALQKEKEERLQRVSDYTSSIENLCDVLSMDSLKFVTEPHPNLAFNIGDDTLDALNLSLQYLFQEKRQRLFKLQSLSASLIELWNLMDTPTEEQNQFQDITGIVEKMEKEVSGSGILSLDKIKKAEAEVERLDKLKASKMKELVLKKQAELEEIYTEAHMEPESDVTEETIIAVIDSGIFDSSELLERMDQQIALAKEEALSRREIMEKMEKWISACEEESWLEEYNRDENRYNASRGAHINLKRAERARVTIQKLPALVETLTAKTKAWEDEHGRPFLYDGVRLTDMLDEHNSLRKDREQEKRRLRDQKRQQEQLSTEQEAFFGSRPSPLKPVSAKKGLSIRGNNAPATIIPNRRLSLGGVMLDAVAPMRKNGGTPLRAGKDGKKERPRPAAPVNYVAIAKEE